MTSFQVRAGRSATAEELQLVKKYDANNDRQISAQELRAAALAGEAREVVSIASLEVPRGALSRQTQAVIQTAKEAGLGAQRQLSVAEGCDGSSDVLARTRDAMEKLDLRKGSDSTLPGLPKTELAGASNELDANKDGRTSVRELKDASVRQELVSTFSHAADRLYYQGYEVGTIAQYLATVAHAAGEDASNFLRYGGATSPEETHALQRDLPAIPAGFARTRCGGNIRVAEDILKDAKNLNVAMGPSELNIDGYASMIGKFAELGKPENLAKLKNASNETLNPLIEDSLRLFHLTNGELDKVYSAAAAKAGVTASKAENSSLVPAWVRSWFSSTPQPEYREDFEQRARDGHQVVRAQSLGYFAGAEAAEVSSRQDRATVIETAGKELGATLAVMSPSARSYAIEQYTDGYRSGRTDKSSPLGEADADALVQVELERITKIATGKK